MVTALSILPTLAAFWDRTPDRDLAELEASYQHTPADQIVLDGARLHLRNEGPRDAPAVLRDHLAH